MSFLKVNKNLISFHKQKFHSSLKVRLPPPRAQHMAVNGEEIQRERDNQLESQEKSWSEKLATHAEAGLRAEKGSHNIRELQKETIEQIKKSTSTNKS
ncbi:hypothetical protein O181_055475 [Austropuccinia psidii MF-1]|uniref:Uncharacterized protein n=1 Tax=Austropuccinia psidii MF-1 TaxID=1389203 RepID=A0A9Q3E4D2_9BASI|nr:hypothetical protein [Austropuccinia psidii MF-1]